MARILHQFYRALLLANCWAEMSFVRAVAAACVAFGSIATVKSVSLVKKSGQVVNFATGATWSDCSLVEKFIYCAGVFIGSPVIIPAALVYQKYLIWKIKNKNSPDDLVRLIKFKGAFTNAKDSKSPPPPSASQATESILFNLEKFIESSKLDEDNENQTTDLGEFSDYLDELENLLGETLTKSLPPDQCSKNTEDPIE